MISPIIIEENEKKPKKKAEIGWEKSLGLDKAYFIIYIPSLTELMHKRWRIKTLKNKVIWISVGLYSVGVMPP